MDVGPSAAPMMAMEAASLSGNPSADAAQSVKKMPNCAAAPKSMSFGFVSSGFEVDHRADADKQQQREEFVCDAAVEEDVQHADFLHAVDDLRHGAGHRDVHEDRAKADWQQQRGLHVLFDREVDQHPADTPHDHLLPCQVRNVLKNCTHR